MINTKKKCKCGAVFYTSDPRTRCMECITTEHNKPTGHKQSEEVYRSGNRNASPIVGKAKSRGQSVGDRIAEGFAIMSGVEHG